MNEALIIQCMPLSTPIFSSADFEHNGGVGVGASIEDYVFGFSPREFYSIKHGEDLRKQNHEGTVADFTSD